MLNTLKSEWTKLHTTRSFWWTTFIFLFFVWGWAILNARLTQPAETPEDVELGMGIITPDGAVTFLFSLGLPVLMIQAIMIVTTEYRFGTQTITFMATPRRWSVAVVKLAMYAVIAAALTFVAVVGAYLLTEFFAHDEVAAQFQPWDDEMGQKQLWKYPLAAALLVLFSQGLGLLLRSTAGSVAIGLILFLGVDNLVAALPKFGSKLVNFMPFKSFQSWLWEIDPVDAPWKDNWVFCLVFIAWALLLWVLGVIVLQKRDA
ncbi:ABC transporter permease [Corynebacterium kefirresidentii]|uniref:ABC transporter permease n=1 Tax=Corynebacterium TaxID=1716 RepID=UPI00290CEA9B|nr:ABC transporter permease [Corynebacterium sp.]MDU7566452.1 ABC transporter permease [Corynebacterium sp.]